MLIYNAYLTQQTAEEIVPKHCEIHGLQQISISSSVIYLTLKKYNA